jgi:hypothetical protein
MPSSKPPLNMSRIIAIDDLATATLNAILRENRVLSSALASVGFGAGLAIAGGAVLALDFTHVVDWPIAALAVVSGAIGAGAALVALGTWQWRKAEKRLRKLEAKLHAAWYLQQEIDAAPIAEQESPDIETFGRRHIAEAQEKADELLRRVMQRPTGPG